MSIDGWVVFTSERSPQKSAVIFFPLHMPGGGPALVSKAQCLQDIHEWTGITFWICVSLLYTLEIHINGWQEQAFLK